MARYEHLPIYKKAMELSVYLEGVVANFSRYHKYAIGAELRGQARAILRLIIEANSAGDDRPGHLRELARQFVASEASTALRQMLSSSFGHLRHAATRRLLLALLRRFSWLHILYFVDAYRLIDRFHSPRPFLTFRAQVHFFRSRLAGAAALFRVGGY